MGMFCLGFERSESLGGSSFGSSGMGVGRGMMGRKGYELGVLITIVMVNVRERLYLLFTKKGP